VIGSGGSVSESNRRLWCSPSAKVRDGRIDRGADCGGHGDEELLIRDRKTVCDGALDRMLSVLNIRHKFVSGCPQCAGLFRSNPLEPQQIAGGPVSE
jgi:hypothetical protein